MTPSRRAARAVPFGLLGLVLGGCFGHGAVAPTPEAPVTGPPLVAAPPDTVSMDVAAADSSAAPTKPEGETKPTQAPPPAPAHPPAGQTPPTTPPAGEQKLSPEQEVGVKLDDAKKAGLAAQTRRDIEEAQRLIAAVDQSTLGATGQEKMATVRSLIASARAAYDTDVEAAAALAHKARLLAGEVGKS